MTLRSIGIVGTGAMGRGIAEVAAQSGIATILVKATPGPLDGARRYIAESLGRAVKKGKLTAEALDDTLSRLTLTSDLDALSSCDVVVESVVEDLGSKRALFAEIEPRLSTAAVLASNTSSLPLGALAGSLRAPQRFVGLHFFSPVPAMKLVEVASTPRTYPAAVERVQELARAMGKTPVMVSDTSGYIVNRLLVPYLLDGISALEARVAPAEAIDTAMKLGCGHPMGPLALADAIGLDIVYAMAKTMHRELRDGRYSPPPLLRRLVLNNHLGKKTKLGIYDYTTDPPRENAELWPAETRLGA
ncbi:MAG TPA: 3-hydroxyacyl-CoA dehydrogenase family protein [Polyangia bacterium]|nr:3-hydroxyacyl-CoA dehydrogenase family protein [Polyangia bacterium]